MIDTPETAEKATPAGPPAASRRRPYITGLLAAGLVALGLVAGAGASMLAAPRDSVMLMQPTSIATLAPDSVVAVKGKVAEIFGNKFVIDDGSGRALVETGRRGEGGKLVVSGEMLTVQGHFDDGFIHGELLVHADGRAESLRPPRHGPRGLLDRLHGPGVDVVAPGAAG
ncbi:hypothetical protein [Mesorhizobium sp. INR15]|uniref:hypothetical protein n=1 Tax=Mesorhizobium sp. INR15 TaxID=2654248 RepID=UPI0018965FC8|nr:hypothetical protein [Mesorhizobium sp. INR15]